MSNNYKISIKLYILQRKQHETSLSKYEQRREKSVFAYVKTKTQISCTVTVQVISAFVFAI